MDGQINGWKDDGWQDEEMDTNILMDVDENCNMSRSGDGDAAKRVKG